MFNPANKEVGWGGGYKLVNIKTHKVLPVLRSPEAWKLEGRERSLGEESREEMKEEWEKEGREEGKGTERERER